MDAQGSFPSPYTCGKGLVPACFHESMASPFGEAMRPSLLRISSAYISSEACGECKRELRAQRSYFGCAAERCRALQRQCRRALPVCAQFSPQHARRTSLMATLFRVQVHFRRRSCGTQGQGHFGTVVSCEELRQWRCTTQKRFTAFPPVVIDKEPPTGCVWFQPAATIYGRSRVYYYRDTTEIHRDSQKRECCTKNNFGMVLNFSS